MNWGEVTVFVAPAKSEVNVFKFEDNWLEIRGFVKEVGNELSWGREFTLLFVASVEVLFWMSNQERISFNILELIKFTVFCQIALKLLNVSIK